MDVESKETEKANDTNERKYGSGRGGWRSGRSYTNQYKYRRGGRVMFKRDNYPTIELPNVDTKLSYREYVINESEDITIDEAEQGYERDVVVVLYYF